MKNSSTNTISYAAIAKAAAVLEEGGVIAFPTETYYGLGVDPFNEKGLKRLFAVKQRPKNKAVLVLVRDRDMLRQVASSIPDPYLPLMQRYWPGPLTLLFPARRNLSDLLTGGTGFIGVRLSSHDVASRLLKRWNKPITATSANVSGTPPAADHDEVARTLGSEIDYILEGGASPGGLSSTIVGFRNRRLAVIRQGQLQLPEL